MSNTVGIIWKFMPYCCLVIDVTMSRIFDCLNIPLCLHAWKWTSSAILVWNSLQKREQLNIHELGVGNRYLHQDLIPLHSDPASMYFGKNFVLKLHLLHMQNLISSVDTLLSIELKRECNQSSDYFCVLICIVLPPCMNF